MLVANPLECHISTKNKYNESSRFEQNFEYKHNGTIQWNPIENAVKSHTLMQFYPINWIFYVFL